MLAPCLALPSGQAFKAGYGHLAWATWRVVVRESSLTRTRCRRLFLTSGSPLSAGDVRAGSALPPRCLEVLQPKLSRLGSTLAAFTRRPSLSAPGSLAVGDSLLEFAQCSLANDLPADHSLHVLTRMGGGRDFGERTLSTGTPRFAFQEPFGFTFCPASGPVRVSSQTSEDNRP